MRNTISSLIMLSAGMVAVVACILLHYSLEATLTVVVSVLFVFMIIGMIAQKLINSMTKEAEERFRQEEEKRREEEAIAAAEEAARLEEETKEKELEERKEQIAAQAAEMMTVNMGKETSSEVETDIDYPQQTESMQE